MKFQGGDDDKGAKSTQAGIRRRASMRKSRSAEVEHVARRPTQKRSIERFEKIVGAVEALLQHSNIEDISFYDIAAEAKISPASVNYLFPTMSALCIELSRRYLTLSSEAVFDAQRELARERNPSWQSWIRNMAVNTREHFNKNRHVSEVCLGPHLSREARCANLAANEVVAQEFLNSLNQVFVMPQLPGLVNQLTTAIDACDAIWSRSYILRGAVDDEALEEIVRLQISYLRSFLPEMLPLSDPES